MRRHLYERRMGSIAIGTVVIALSSLALFGLTEGNSQVTTTTMTFDPTDQIPAGTSISNPQNARLVDGQLLVDIDTTPISTMPAYVDALLARTNKAVITGELTAPFRRDSPGDAFTLDARLATLYYDTSDSTAAPISIGKGATCKAPAVIGGRVIGRIPLAADWTEVKSKWDAAGVRLECTGQAVAYGIAVKNVEDGFEPHPALAANNNTTDTFLLDGSYFERIRDDAIENDQGMNGIIRDCYVEGGNTFLSEQTDSQNISNPGSIVEIDRCLIHMFPMPNSNQGGSGYLGLFKFRSGSGLVAMHDTVVLLDSVPKASSGNQPWPRGTYTNVTVVLGPSYPPLRPSYLPASVAVTRDMTVWETARAAWVAAHPGLIP